MQISALVAAHLVLIAFIGGMVVEYLGVKFVKKMREIHPGLSLEQDFEAKVRKIVQAELVAAQAQVK